jgi:hypothetical protein
MPDDTAAPLGFPAIGGKKVTPFFECHRFSQLPCSVRVVLVIN